MANDVATRKGLSTSRAQKINLLEFLSIRLRGDNGIITSGTTRFRVVRRWVPVVPIGRI